MLVCGSTRRVEFDDGCRGRHRGIVARRFCSPRGLSELLDLLKIDCAAERIPLALYMDRHGIFRRNDEHRSLQGVALSQSLPFTPAKGCVERLFNTLQNRLIRSSGLLRLPQLNKLRRFSTVLLKRTSMRGTKPARVKRHGGRYPKDLMSIESAALAINRL